MKHCYKNDQNVANRFTLTGGEKFKVGRIVFYVKELVTDQVQYFSEKESQKPEIYQSVSEPAEEEDLLSLTDDGHPHERDMERHQMTPKIEESQEEVDQLSEEEKNQP